MDEPQNETQNQPSATPKVTGIGGIFFFSGNPKETREWYAKNLGLEVNDWGSTFESRSVDKPEEVNSLQWSPFQTGSDYFAPSTKGFMINYRVQNIEGLVAQLKANGVTVLDDIASYDYGKFVHILDADGNKVELWEPA
ncbi:VOC family protein [Hymenobacter pini]|uniref:VOC family protein n=1 Tax=Hymenobacter pini TaxID=2880879 RepID=UPI001CF34FA6|nr:VOC family protein [Hymenobacter pini]MCA8831149.1 VOC family protein [Hymenobacter pini]